MVVAVRQFSGQNSRGLNISERRGFEGGGGGVREALWRLGDGGCVYDVAVELSVSKLKVGRRWKVVGDGYKRWRWCC